MIKSKVPLLLQIKDWTPYQLVKRGLPEPTAYKVANGEAGFSIQTLDKLCKIFNVDSVSEIIEYSIDE